jgi:GNAT superfamily N-acetyltransferase
MTHDDGVTTDDLRLMQRMAQRLTATHPDMINADASYGELAWIFGKDASASGHAWRRRLWFDGADLAAWGWATMPREIPRSDGTVRRITGASLALQVDPDHAELVDEVADWFDGIAAGLERTVVAQEPDTYGVGRWTAHGYDVDPETLGDTGGWTQVNVRDLDDIETPVLPDGYRFRTAGEVGPEAAVRAHVDAWAPSTYTAASYEGVRQTEAYRPDLHFLVEAPDGTMAASTIMWLDEFNQSVEFEPVGTHPEHRRRGLSRAMLLHAMRKARDEGAKQATVVCLGAPGRPAARGLYYSVGFHYSNRDITLIKPTDT